MSAQPTVLLFDIDGTLLRTGGAGRRSMRQAFHELFGRPDVLDAMDFRGMTDPLILEGGLLNLGEAPTPEHIRALTDAYLRALAVEVPASTDYEVLPGVRELLAHLSRRECLALGLGTGNTQAGARTKLAHGDIWHHFGFGGFGDDHIDRVEVIRAGAARGAGALRAPLEACRVVVIGDTPKDAYAARGIDAACLAVLTGGYSEAELRDAGAEWVVPDLSHPSVLPALLGHSL